MCFLCFSDVNQYVVIKLYLKFKSVCTFSFNKMVEQKQLFSVFSTWKYDMEISSGIMPLFHPHREKLIEFSTGDMLGGMGQSNAFKLDETVPRLWPRGPILLTQALALQRSRRFFFRQEKK